MTSVHHILPRSRGGKNKDNTVVLPGKIHKKWHALFKEMTPEEAKCWIDEVMVAGKHWNNTKINQLYRKYNV